MKSRETVSSQSVGKNQGQPTGASIAIGRHGKDAALALGILLLTLGFSVPAYSSPLTVNSLVAPTVINFSQFVASPLMGQAGPTQVGTLVGENVTLTGNPNSGLYLYNTGWNFLGNGVWDGNMQGFVGANNARPGSIRFAFNSGPVSGVGAFMNHCPSGCSTVSADLVIYAYDINNNLLESFNVTQNAPILTPAGTNAGAFRGFSRSTADISFFVVEGNVPAVDDLSFVRPAASVPEPTSLMLLGSGLAGFALTRLKRRQRQG